MQKFFPINKSTDADEASNLIAMDSAKNSGNRTIQPFASDFGGCEIELRLIPKEVYVSGSIVPDADSADQLIHTFNAANNYELVVTDELSLDYDLYCYVTGGTGISGLNINFS